MWAKIDKLLNVAVNCRFQMLNISQSVSSEAHVPFSYLFLLLVRLGWKNYFRRRPNSLRALNPRWTLWFQANCSRTACFFFFATHHPVRETVFEGSLVVGKAKTACRPPRLSGGHISLLSVSLCVTDTLPLSVANRDDRKAGAFGSC